MEPLDPDAFHCVAAWLDTADLVRLGATCARLRASVLEDDALWRSACVRDWGLAPPLDVGSGRDVWRRSHAAFGAVGAASFLLHRRRRGHSMSNRLVELGDVRRKGNERRPLFL